MKSKLRGLAPFLFLAVVVFVGWAFVFRDSPQANTSPQIETKNSSPPPSTPSAPPAPTFNKTAYSLTDPASIWVIASKAYPLKPLDYMPADLVSVGGNQQMRKEAAAALLSMLSAAKTDGLKIQPVSGYRSYTRQKQVYQNEVNTYGQATADTESAKPGYSEHQTGWSIDVGAVDDKFANSKEGQWVAANAWKYGFIIRYPQGKQDITGYRYEPWHIRYIGTDLSTEMHDKRITTLEEFFGV